MMKIDYLVSGLYETNSYILREYDDSSECLVIDTSLDDSSVVNYLIAMNYEPKALILTHGHADHIAGIAEMKQKWPGLKVYISNTDADMLTNPNKNLSLLTGYEITAKPADVLLNEGDIIEEVGIKLSVISTPGHTPGGICLYCEDEGILFSGDTLFDGSVGRTDFPGGNMEDLIQSIRVKLLGLANETAVYPGHGPKTTIEREKKYNPFLKN